MARSPKTRATSNSANNFISLYDYGASGNGTIDASSAINAMAEDLGYVNFPSGTFRITNIDLNIYVPVYFAPQGSILVGQDNKVTFWNTINSIKQHIFKYEEDDDGNLLGDILFKNDNADGIGEDSRNLHCTWFGIFPIGQKDEPQTKYFKKAMDALAAQSREGVFELDVASYYLDEGFDIPKSIWIKGQGTRRTIFDLKNKSGYGLKAVGSGVRISGVQMEQQDGEEGYLDGSFIIIDSDRCYVDDIAGWSSKYTVELTPNADFAKVTNVYGRFGYLPDVPRQYMGVDCYPEDSALVVCNSQDCTIDSCEVSGTTYGPNSVVLINNMGTKTVSRNLITNIVSDKYSIPVKFHMESSATINNLVSNVVHFENSSVPAGFCPGSVTIEGLTGSDMYGLLVSNVVASSSCKAFIYIKAASDSRVSRVSLNNAISNNSDCKAAIIYNEKRTDIVEKNLIELIVMGDGWYSTNSNPIDIVTGESPFVYTPTYYTI